MVTTLAVGTVWAQRGPAAKHVATAGRAAARARAAEDTATAGVDGPTTSTPATTVAPVTLPPIRLVPATIPKAGPPRTDPPVTQPALPAQDPAQLGLYLVNADTGVVSPVLLHYSFENVSFSPNGRRLVFAGRAGDALPNGVNPTKLWTINSDGTGLTPIAVESQYPEEPSWSPDGRWIAYYAYPVDSKGDEALYLLDTKTQAIRLLDYVDQGRAPLEWSPDSSRIAIASPNHQTIAVVDVPTGAKTEAPVPPAAGAISAPNSVYEVSWTRDGQHLVVSYQWDPVVVTSATGTDIVTLNPSARYAQASPTAATVSEWVDFNTYLQPLDGGPARLLATGFDPLDWSHDGTLIAGESGTSNVVAINAATGTVHPLIQETTWGACPAGWSPTGHVFALVIERSAARRY